jgi:hypothetical protein
MTNTDSPTPTPSSVRQTLATPEAEASFVDYQQTVAIAELQLQNMELQDAIVKSQEANTALNYKIECLHEAIEYLPCPNGKYTGLPEGGWTGRPEDVGATPANIEQCMSDGTCDCQTGVMLTRSSNTGNTP